MAITFEQGSTKRVMRDATAWERLQTNREWLSFWFMLPAAAFLILFLAYPLVLGVWLSFTDARIGRSGVFIGLENYEWLMGDFDLHALGIQHAALYRCRQYHQICGRALSRAVAEQEVAIQGNPSRLGADPIYRANRALRHCVLVAVRSAVLDHFVVATRKWA